MGEPSCPFENSAALYCRKPDGTLIEAFGRFAPAFKGVWDSRLKARIINEKGDNTVPFRSAGQGGCLVAAIKHIILSNDGFSPPLSEAVTGQVDKWVRNTHIYEHKVAGEKQVRGIVFFRPAATKDTEQQTELLNWFVQIALMTSRLSGCDVPAVEDEKAMITTGMITRVFSENLRNIAEGDMWDATGMSFFFERIMFFVSRGLPVEAVLPAFPCKSSCLDKVSGTDPDKGEELALKSIHRFVETVKECYSPGVSVFIVSDGHVFSDCIGVDDDVVDTYGNKLVEMRDALFGEKSHGTIPFVRLPSLFHLENPGIPQPETPRMESHIATAHTDEADLCRQLLMATCTPSAASLREKIKVEASTLALYRGFSRFMLEDLSLHPSLARMSKSQRKKVATRVSFEMMLRNQAYSNLVEMVFPAHLRLSIHAHTNSGPKFGVALLAHSGCRVVDNLLTCADDRGELGEGEKSDDLLHIPTPWHNSIAKVAGRDGWIVIKKKAITEAVAAGGCVSSWVQGTKGGGGYTLVTMNAPATTVLPAPLPGPEMPEQQQRQFSLWQFLLSGIYRIVGIRM